MNEQISDVRTFVCFSCMQPNEYDRQFCKFCNAPISQTTSNDPLQIAYGEGLAYRKAMEGKPKPIVVVGVWIIFFPTFVVSALAVLATLVDGGGTMGFILFWIMFIVAAFCFTMLYRVTKNYVSMEKVEHSEPEDFDFS